MILKRNTEPQNFSQNSPKIQKYLGIIYLLSITPTTIPNHPVAKTLQENL